MAAVRDARAAVLITAYDDGDPDAIRFIQAR